MPALGGQSELTEQTTARKSIYLVKASFYESVIQDLGKIFPCCFEPDGKAREKIIGPFGAEPELRETAHKMLQAEYETGEAVALF